MKNVLKVSFSIFFLVSCTSTNAPHVQRSYDLMNVLYHKNAAETKALQYQAYNIATQSVEKLKINTAAKKKKAVVLDIDETVFDNSPYQVDMNLNDEMYPKGWVEWTSQGKAKLIPGVKDFLSLVDKKKIEIFFITNRTEEERAGTENNIKLYNLPVKPENVFYKTNTSSKKERRQKVLSNFEIILLVGDNLADFDDLFDQRQYEQRDQTVEKLKTYFGHKFVLLPNPMYGDWEGALYDWKFPKTSKEKEEVLKKILKEKNTLN